VYGPTETTIWSTVSELTAEEVDRVTVGRPIANTRVHLLDARGRPVPPGVVGELCLAGGGLAEGYHGQPELTAQRFPTDVHIGRYYRTGDLARMLPDSRIELLGRRDRQVKLRAHRIELTEVERALTEHGEVRAAAVVLHGDPVADGYLAGYLVGDERPGLVEDVWSYARSRLPSYSVPSRIVMIDALPQTPNGKVDLNALAEREPPPTGATAVAEPAEEGIEAQLVQVWRDVLRRPTLGKDANFFLNGGTSIMAVRLAATVTARCGVQVGIGMIFRAPTPEALAGFLQASTA
jgi:acyl-coenzyme A synthetase/AMP-(fatty) acid ligase